MAQDIYLLRAGIGWQYRETLLQQVQDWEPVLRKLGKVLGQSIAFKRRLPSGHIRVLCPFHAEKTPSMCLYRHGHYHCYACGALGDMTGYVFALILGDWERSDAKQVIDTFFEDLRGPTDPARQLRDSIVEHDEIVARDFGFNLSRVAP